MLCSLSHKEQLIHLEYNFFLIFEEKKFTLISYENTSL